MIRRRLSCAIAVAMLALACAAPAQAAIDIESFTTTSSDSQAGGHPDLTTSIALEDPGAPEVAKNIIFEAPEGVFGNPNAVSRCTAADFALKQCSVNAQAGIVTLHANYESNPEFLLGTAPVFDMVAAGERDRTPGLHRTDGEHPDRDPDHGAHRQRLRTAIHRLRTDPNDPGEEDRLHGLGDTCPDESQSEALPERIPAPAVQGLPTQLHQPADPGEHRDETADRLPDDLHRRTAGHRARRPVLPRSGQPLPCRVRIPAGHRL